MRKSKFNETQIVSILKDAEGGIPVPDLLRKHGISKATFFKWRSKYGGASSGCRSRLGTRRTVRLGKFSRSAQYTRWTCLWFHGRPSTRSRSKSFQKPQRG